MILSKDIVNEIEQELYNFKNGFGGEWEPVIRNTINFFKNTPKGWLMNMLYIEKQTPEKIQVVLHISQSAFYLWKAEIIYYAALVACSKGLIAVN